MPFAAALSNRPTIRAAIDETTQAIAESLGQQKPDLACVFVSHHHAAEFGELAGHLQARLGARVLVGCTGESIVGGSVECEDQPALSVWCGILPGAELMTFHLTFEQTPDGLLCSGLPEDLEDRQAEARVVLLLGDPYTSLPQSVLATLADELPGVPVVGGMASGGGFGENRLFLGDELIDAGAIGVVIQRGPKVRTVVSQGCRPIGTTFVVTRAERNIIYELGGVPPLERLEKLFAELPDRDKQLVDNGVHIGVAMNEYQDRFRRGDFLIVNVHGVDRESGALATGGLMRVGQTVQFHIRDAETADEDLQHLLEQELPKGQAAVRGGLLFSCNGRGTRMFPAPHHDARSIQRAVGPVPLAGFFAQGEIGPVGGKNYVHGFTASLLVFEEG